ncbi:penicillin acylase family protein [Candidatus Thorarchaeota archaeon]|nr:MAG: penicillin acylase family protein [Candidatus Thorarchaeota archaeon]
MKRKIINLGLSFIGPVALIVLLTMPIGPLAGGLGILQPWGGIFDVGRGIQHQNTERVILPDVISGAEVIIDEWGIPHIYGDTVEDAFIALGYMHARDRLFQIVMQVYLASGRISEVVGGEDYAIDADKFHRSIGLAKSAEDTYQWYLDNADSNDDVDYTLRCVHAHVIGINAFIDSMTSETTPIEFKILGFTPKHFTPIDSFIWAKYMTWGLSGGVRDLRNEFIRSTLNNDTMYSELFPEVYPNTIPIIPEQYNLSLADFADAPGGYPAMIVPPPSFALNEEPQDLISIDKLNDLLEITSKMINLFGDTGVIGSNSWAVNGSKTSNGQAILANDPHLSLQAPSLWYEVHIVVLDEEEPLNVQGGSLPGTPGVLIGHTEHISWGMTNVGADVLDIFVEQLNPLNPIQYRYNNEWRNLVIRNETIKVKGGPDVDFQVFWSVHGPCIDSVISTYYSDTEESHPNLAMNWTGLSITHEVLTLGLLNRANNLDDYFEAMYWWDSPPHNFIYADDEGNIALTVAGRFPIRQGYSGNFPITALNDSVGMISNVPYAFNPRSVNPTQCFLQSANQKSIDPASYPYTILGAQSPDYRGERIHSVLESWTNITVEDMMKLQADVVDLTAEKLLPYVLDAWSTDGHDDDKVEQLIEILEVWDYKMSAELIAPTIWIYLLDAIRWEVFDEVRSKNLDESIVQIPVLEWVITEHISFYIDDHSTPESNETLAEILVRALDLTSINLYELSDDVEDWVYGKYHTILIKHLAGLTYIGGGAHSGSGYTINVGSGWVVQSGPSRRMVVSYEPTPKYYTVYPGGQSQVMFSPHWDDLFQLWYTYNETTAHYGYILEFNYLTAEAFNEADDGSMIEYIILFRPRS